MDGLGFGAVCYRDSAELAASACSSISGVTGAGVASCSNPAVTGTVLTYTLRVDSASGTSTRAVTVDLQPCEPQDIQTWAPALAAWLSALVAILCARMVVTRMFNRDSSV